MRTLLPGPIVCTLLLSSLVAAPLAAQSSGEPLYPPAGLDMSATDSSTRPGDDFYQYANGAWLARVTIPADRPYVSEWLGMRDRTEAQLRDLIQAAAANASHEPRRSRARSVRFTSPLWTCSDSRHLARDLSRQNSPRSVRAAAAKSWRG